MCSTRIEMFTKCSKSNTGAVQQRHDLLPNVPKSFLPGEKEPVLGLMEEELLRQEKMIEFAHKQTVEQNKVDYMANLSNKAEYVKMRRDLKEANKELREFLANESHSEPATAAHIAKARQRVKKLTKDKAPAPVKQGTV